MKSSHIFLPVNKSFEKTKTNNELTRLTRICAPKQTLKRKKSSIVYQKLWIPINEQTQYQAHSLLYLKRVFKAGLCCHTAWKKCDHLLIRSFRTNICCTLLSFSPPLKQSVTKWERKSEYRVQKVAQELRSSVHLHVHLFTVISIFTKRQTSFLLHS